MHQTVPAACLLCINYFPWPVKLFEVLYFIGGFLSPNNSKTLIVVTQHPLKQVHPGLGEHTELRIPKRT